MDKNLNNDEYYCSIHGCVEDPKTLNQQECCCQECDCKKDDLGNMFDVLDEAAKQQESTLTREELARQLYLLSTLRDDGELHLWTNGIIACDSGMFDRNLSGVAQDCYKRIADSIFYDVIRSEKNWHDGLSEREIQEVRFAMTYYHDFNHGTSGHLAYTVIAKLAEKLGASDE